MSSEQGNFNALPHLPVEYADKISGDLSRSLSRSGPVHFGSKKLISFNFNALPHLPVEYANKVSGDLSRSLSRSGPVHFRFDSLSNYNESALV